MEPSLGRRLYLAHRAVSDELDRRLREHGASLWNWLLLREAATAEGASQRELAGLMRIEPPTLVRHLDKLTRDGFVERHPDPRDRRVLRVVVTKSGRRRLAQLQEVVHEVDAELRSVLTQREIEVLGKALNRVHAYFAPDKPDKEVAGARRR
jgi:DNA-binding MarR family transcriptional regulator